MTGDFLMEGEAGSLHSMGAPPNVALHRRSQAEVCGVARGSPQTHLSEMRGQRDTAGMKSAGARPRDPLPDKPLVSPPPGPRGGAAGRRDRPGLTSPRRAVDFRILIQTTRP